MVRSRPRRSNIERAAELIEAGVDAEEARRTAIAQFGDVEDTRRHARATAALRERRPRRRQLLAGLRKDLVLGLRQQRDRAWILIEASRSRVSGWRGAWRSWVPPTNCERSTER